MKYLIKSNIVPYITYFTKNTSWSLSEFIMNQLVYIIHFSDEYAAKRITRLFVVRSSIPMLSFEIRTD